MNIEDYATNLVDEIIGSFYGGLDNEWNELELCGEQDQQDEIRQGWIEKVIVYLQEAPEKVIDLT